MRLRKVPGMDQRLLDEYPELVYMDTGDMITEDFLYRRFPGHNSVNLEIGMGKGDFIRSLAKSNPEEAFIGVEMHSEVLKPAAEKLYNAGIDNVAVLIERGEYLLNWLNPGEVSRIYLNFSDPWPKYHHRKRRLTHGNYLKLYRLLLKEKGELQFRTDSRELFEFSLKELSFDKWLLEEVSLDFHSSKFFDGNQTEYERKKSQQGPIYYLKAVAD